MSIEHSRSRPFESSIWLTSFGPILVQHLATSYWFPFLLWRFALLLVKLKLEISWLVPFICKRFRATSGCNCHLSHNVYFFYPTVINQKKATVHWYPYDCCVSSSGSHLLPPHVLLDRYYYDVSKSVRPVFHRLQVLVLYEMPAFNNQRSHLSKMPVEFSYMWWNIVEYRSLLADGT